MRLGKQKGATTVNGLQMLVGQAEASWLLWNQEK
jgi:shikimate dehydrogenase